MILKLDLSSDIPLYQQIRNQIVLAVGKGELKPGESLPTVRQLASDIGVNSMTVNKAYALLKSEGYLLIDRRKGAQVCPLKEKHVGPDADFMEKLTLLAAEATAKGLTKEIFLAACKQAAEKMSQKEE